MSENIIIMGGDGFCGWPTSLHLSNLGYNVTIVDNLIRRKIDVDLECDSLTPIKPISQRIKKWYDLTGKTIKFEKIDISLQYNKILNLIKELKPKAIVHFAEQRAAPTSMISSYWKRYTVENNTNATHNILCAVVESGIDVHVVHLGTTGTAGYVTTPMDIPEGYLDVKVQTDKGEEIMEFPWPLHSPSIYHMTKSMDFLMFEFYNNNDNIKCTDLRQGIVWGCQTKETMMDENLINRWDYDHWYGTALNRFLIQSTIKHPITIYGRGLQTRAFIHIQNTVECIQLAIENPPIKDKVRVLNQVTECHNLLNLANKIKLLTDAEIKYYKNPRKEAPENKLRFDNSGLLKLGLNSITLDDGLLYEINEIAKKYKDRCDISKVMVDNCTWNKNIKIDGIGYDNPQ